MKMYDADSLIAKLEAAREKLLMHGQIAAERNVAKFALQVVYDEPSIDAEPVLHGRWEWITEDVYRCENCGERVHVKEVMGMPVWEYCPDCGAKMDGGAEE